MGEKEIAEALQQMTGFRIGKWGGNVRELVSSMGLEKNEWEHIKKKEESGHLNDNDIMMIEEYFESQKVVKKE